MGQLKRSDLAPCADHSVVALGTGAYDHLPYALKFFASRKPFDAALALHRRDSLKALAPSIQTVYDPAAADGVTAGSADRFGRPLPPCIVMLRGESLTEWIRRSSPDVFQAVAVRNSHVKPANAALRGPTVQLLPVYVQECSRHVCGIHMHTAQSAP